MKKRSFDSYKDALNFFQQKAKETKSVIPVHIVESANKFIVVEDSADNNAVEESPLKDIPELPIADNPRPQSDQVNTTDSVSVARHEEMYKGYKIVAQFWKCSFQGRAWGDGGELYAEGKSIADVVEQLKRKIPKGGAKEPFTPPDLTHYVGTMNSVGRVFHRSKCGWMNNVKTSDEVTFKSREAALAAGYSPCHSCRP